jgi:cobalt/nickel transport system permease protein
MHIPDGFLDAKAALATAGLSAAGLGTALRQARLHLPRRSVPMMGLAAAFVFAAQMLNFPVAAGTSGHLVGAVLVAVLLGPAAAVIVVSAVLIVQCLLFADGGLSALGANIFNMALVGSISGYAIYSAMHKVFPGPRGRLAAVAFASWCATVLAAVCCAGELAWSGTVPWSAVLPAMAGVHMLIGLGEAAITAMVIAALDRSGWAQSPAGSSLRPGGLAAYGLLLALGLALFVVPFASPWPDGLEKTASVLGFAHKAADHPAAAAWAGCLGTATAFACAWGLAGWLAPARRSEVKR